MEHPDLPEMLTEAGISYQFSVLFTYCVPGESVALQLPEAAVSFVRAQVFGVPPPTHPATVSNPCANSVSRPDSNPRYVLTIAVPGAPRSTAVVPKLEKPAMPSVFVVAAT